MPPHITIGELIRVARARIDITQTEAAKQIGKTKQQWSQWETGVHCPTYRCLCEIAGALDLQPHELIWGEKDRDYLGSDF